MRKSRTEFKPETKIADAIFRATSILYRTSEGGEYEANSVEITVGADGAIHFSDPQGDSFIYFYPEQIKHLRAAMKMLVKKPARAQGEEEA